MPTTTSNRPLGTNQRSFLDACRRHGGWYPGQGWIWENRSTTVKIAESLVRRGLLTRVERSVQGRPGGPTRTVVSYVLPAE